MQKIIVPFLVFLFISCVSQVDEPVEKNKLSSKKISNINDWLGSSLNSGKRVKQVRYKGLFNEHYNYTETFKYDESNEIESLAAEYVVGDVHENSSEKYYFDGSGKLIKLNTLSSNQLNLEDIFNYDFEKNKVTKVTKGISYEGDDYNKSYEMKIKDLIHYRMDSYWGGKDNKELIQLKHSVIDIKNKSLAMLKFNAFDGIDCNVNDLIFYFRSNKIFRIVNKTLKPRQYIELSYDDDFLSKTSYFENSEIVCYSLYRRISENELEIITYNAPDIPILKILVEYEEKDSSNFVYNVF